MESSQTIIDKLQERMRNNQYRIRMHAVRHMIEEGFDENHLIEAMLGKLRILESYSEESRYLILGYFHFTTGVKSPSMLCVT
jgi:hypothetical protein